MCVSFCFQSMADKTVDHGPWTGCAVMFLQSLCPNVNLLSLYKDRQGKFIVFKVIKLTLIGEHARRVFCIFSHVSYINEYVLLSDSAGGLGGYEILKVHDADPFLGVEVKFVDVAACQQFLESYSSGAVRQSLSQHACRLFALPQELMLKTQLKASTHILDLYMDKLELCLEHIHLSQVFFLFLSLLSNRMLLYSYSYPQKVTQCSDLVLTSVLGIQNRWAALSTRWGCIWELINQVLDCGHVWGTAHSTDFLLPATLFHELTACFTLLSVCVCGHWHNINTDYHISICSFFFQIGKVSFHCRAALIDSTLRAPVCPSPQHTLTHTHTHTHAHTPTYTRTHW